MTGILHITSWIFIIIGSGFCLIGAIGLHRFSDFFSRTHASGCVDTIGAGCLLIGMMIQSPDALVCIKLGGILVFLLISSPTSSYALARAALSHGCRPVADGGDASGILPEEPSAISQTPLEENGGVS